MSVSETTLLGRNDVKPGKHCICTMHYHVPQHGGWQLCRRAACSACSTSSIESVMIDCHHDLPLGCPSGNDESQAGAAGGSWSRSTKLHCAGRAGRYCLTNL